MSGPYVSPVDMPQAMIGKGMEIFTRFGKVLNADGSEMTVREALALIMDVYDEIVAEGDEAYDRWTRWAVNWFEIHGFDSGPVDDAEKLCKARSVTIGELKSRSMVRARRGKVQLLDDPEMPLPRDPELTHWRAMLVAARQYERAGQTAVLQTLGCLGAPANPAGDLASRCYRICTTRGWPKRALLFNAFATDWPLFMAAMHQIIQDQRREGKT